MTQDTDKIARDVEAAVADEVADVSARVRQITLKVLSEGQLDSAALKSVMDAVVRGAKQGVERPDPRNADALREAMTGLDDALASAAEATTLAMQEAASRSSEFSKQSLKQSLDDLGSLEKLFIETLGDAARQSSGHVRDTLHSLAEHARSSGTAVGGRVQGAVSQLAQAMSDMTQEQMQAGAHTLRQQGALLAGIAAGFLKGVADRLQAPDAPDRD
ncbi:DUF6781 family protein [Denitromonas ohlonensis]|uniref:Uncharacterized protein n=2 Tax=Denitromonas TaxID=139331 RepID=A0A557SBT6_9RHOO|nr:DUF6781 family protein [Denitromonas ohlonensis]TVO68483.1 hypothetical protein FHP90_04180 [Denitromonas ohlonensis]TVO74761.1 hypothetical protein FHP89_15730 [Denitromonas ohlonensis]